MTDIFFGISRRKFTADELKLLATAVADGVAQQARIDKLTTELKHCIYELDREGSRKWCRVRRAGLARAALKENK